MVTLRNKLLQTFRSQGVSMLVLEFMWVAIMTNIGQLTDQGRGSLSKLICL